MTPTASRRTALLSAAAYAGMFVFGLVMALLGAVLPALAGRLQFEISGIGSLFLAMNGAMLVSSSVVGLAVDRFGMKPLMAAGPLLVSAALGIMARASAFSELYPAVALLGVGGGALNGATNTLVADLHDDPRRKGAALNVLGVFFGFGALFLPFLTGALLSRWSIGAILLAAAALCGGAGLFAASLSFPAPKQGHAMPVADMPRFLRSPLVLAFAFLLFFESGVEFTLGGFISTYLAHDMAVSSLSEAAWVLAGYWGAIMLSRTVLGRMTNPDPYRVLLWSALGACAGAILAAVASSVPIATVAVILTGWSLAGIYPTALGIAGARFQSHSGTVFGILFTVALAGGMMLPWLAGSIGSAAGLRWVFVMVGISFFAVLVLGRVAASLEGSTVARNGRD